MNSPPEPKAPSRAAAWLAHHERAASWLLCALFSITAATQLRLGAHRLDEGVYIMQAARVLRGQMPYSGFFYHQTPLYLYALAAFDALSPASLFASRLLSLLAAALSGVVVMRLARQVTGPGPALGAQLAFYGAPLHQYSILALPNALMGLASSAGMLLLCRDGDRRKTALAGVCFVAAVMIKPLDVPVVLAAVLALALQPEQRRKLPVLAMAGLGSGLAAWLGFHLASKGGFTQVLRLQAGRYAGRSGFEAMSHVAEFHDEMVRRHVRTPLQWNVSEHWAAFAHFGPLNANLWLLLAGTTGLWLGRKRLPAQLRLLLPLWLLIPFGFSLFVWEPIWDHYFLQYVPPLAIGAAMTLSAALDRSRRARRTALTLLALYSLLGFASRPPDRPFFARAAEIKTEVGKRPYLSFGPLLHVVNGTEPACGLIDPMNVYGDHCAAALVPNGPLMRFHVTSEALIQCIGQNMPVVVDRYAFWFMDAHLLAHLDETRNRLIFFTPADHIRFDALAAAQRSPSP